MSVRDEIARLPTGSPYLRKNDDALGLVYRTHENEAAPAPAADDVPSDAALGDNSDAIAQLWEKIDRLDEASDQCFEHLNARLIPYAINSTRCVQ